MEGCGSGTDYSQAVVDEGLGLWDLVTDDMAFIDEYGQPILAMTRTVNSV